MSIILLVMSIPGTVVSSCDAPWSYNVAAEQHIRLLAIQGKYAQAEELFERSQATLEIFLDPQHPHVALSLDNRANLLERQVGVGRAHDYKID